MERRTDNQAMTWKPGSGEIEGLLFDSWFDPISGPLIGRGGSALPCTYGDLRRACATLEASEPQPLTAAPTTTS